MIEHRLKQENDVGSSIKMFPYLELNNKAVPRALKEGCAEDSTICSQLAFSEPSS